MINKDLLEKFIKIIDYKSDFREDLKKGLKRIELNPEIEIEHSGVIRITFTILESDFYETTDNREKVFFHQTVFELRRGYLLTPDELIEMFLFTQDRFLKTKFEKENKKIVEIKDLYPTGEPLQKEHFFQQAVDGAEHVAKLWK